jgi:chromate reductase
MKILAFGASSNRNSINQRLALFAAHQFEDAEIRTIDLNDYEMPFYSIDKERAIGIPQEAYTFVKYIEEADLIIISFAEHNGSYSSIFKNLFDWASRVHIKTFMGKPMLLMAASSGKRGAISVLDAAVLRFPIHDGLVVGKFSFPEFNKNFNDTEGIVNPELKYKFDDILAQIKTRIINIESGTKQPKS